MIPWAVQARNADHTRILLREARAISTFPSDLCLPLIRLSSLFQEIEFQCLQRRRQSPESDSCLPTLSLRPTLHSRPLPSDESLRISSNIRSAVPFGIIYHGSGSLPVRSENSIEELYVLLLQHRLIKLARIILASHNLSALRDTVDQA